MLDNYGIRTDLALEATERFTEENVEVRAGYAEAFRPVQSDSQTSEWYSYFENDVLGCFWLLFLCVHVDK